MDSIKRTVELLALNVDFEKYTEFRDKTPAVFIFEENNVQIQEIGKIGYNKENVLFCLNFSYILNASMKIVK